MSHWHVVVRPKGADPWIYGTYPSAAKAEAVRGGLPLSLGDVRVERDCWERRVQRRLFRELEESHG